MRSNFQAIDRAAVYSKADVAKARQAVASATKGQGEPLTEGEALELIRKHRELEAQLVAQEKAEETETLKAKRVEFIRRKQSAMAAMAKGA